MEAFDDKSSNKEPTPEELNRLLRDSCSWIGKIIEEHNTEQNPDSAITSATTPEAEENYKEGSVRVKSFKNNEFEVTITETDYLKSELTTIERFRLSFAFGVGEYELQATGLQSDDPQDETFHPATPAEIQRLAYVLEIGAHGDVRFDFDRFEIEFQHHLDELDMAKYAAEEKTEDEDHPE